MVGRITRNFPARRLPYDVSLQIARRRDGIKDEDLREGRQGGRLFDNPDSVHSNVKLSRPKAPEVGGTRTTTAATCQVRLAGRQINLAVSRHVTSPGTRRGAVERPGRLI